MFNDKSTGLEVGNGCGLTLPSSAALYIHQQVPQSQAIK